MIKIWPKGLLRKADKWYIDNNTKNQSIHAIIQNYALHSATNHRLGITETKRDQALTVSLTTYGQRIHTVYLTIESILVQSLKADRIVLWLAEDEFTYEHLPETLKNQEKRGLTIKFCKDIRSYKKLIPGLNTYPNDLIVTIDDDIIYPIDHIDRLYKAYLKEPDIIHCHRAHRMQFNENGQLLPYNQWLGDHKSDIASIDIFPTGCGGILYFPGCFHSDTDNETLFTSLCPHADDVWFKFMTLKKGYKAKVIQYSRPWEEYVIIPETKGKTLWNINVVENDKQIEELLNHYPDIQRSIASMVTDDPLETVLT